MTQSAPAKANSRNPNKAFIGGYIESGLVDALQVIADRDFRGNKSHALEKILQEGVNHRAPRKGKKI
jgi:hypothetical protein